MTIRIDKELFQWEKNRYVYVDSSAEEPVITYVQFYNGREEIGPERKLEQGRAKIPNYLLQKSLPITALACEGEQKDGTKVIARRTFKVIPRAKPDTYFNDEEEDVGIEVIYDGGVEV